jgi:hypothetical protein
MGGAGTGEAVVCDPNGVAIFDALHRRDTVSEATLNTFDLLELVTARTSAAGYSATVRNAWRGWCAGVASTSC